MVIETFDHPIVGAAPLVADRIERMDSLRYTVYLGLLADAFKRLLAYYGEVEREAATSEGESMALYVQKILATVQALRLKHSFSPDYFARPGVDLADSGFPHFHDIMTFDADLSTRGERLPKLPEIDFLRHSLLEYLMSPKAEVPVRNSEECRKIQWMIAERAYLEQLDLRKQFFRFTPGKLFAADPKTFSEEKGRRAYHFSWGCYDSQRNRPCVYFMLMTQDESEVSLEQKDNPEFVRFLQAIDNIASRAPEGLSSIAVRLDEAFRKLYPKALKRFCLGPLVSPLLWNGCKTSSCPKLAQVLLPYFREAGVEENDFVLFFSTEMVVSEREETPSTLRSVLGDKARQIFHVPKNDRKLLRRGASAYQMYCILPHRLRQHLNNEVLAEVHKLLDVDGLEMLTYQRTEEGVTNVG
jgi:hypothetical protein